jgi:hypothetical protein
MAKYTQTRDELLGHLKDQITFMIQSASSYDNGFEDEAKRLAVVIRVLVHDTSNSTSLLTLLNRKNIKFYDSAVPYDPRNLLSYNGLTMIKISTSEGASYVAPLDGGAPTRSRTKKISFNVWWENMFVIKDKDGETFTRKDLVLNTVNRDGGAHIDLALDKAYADLTRFNSLGWKFFKRGVEDDFRNNPVLPSIRQIAHEFLKTLKDGVIDLISDRDKLLLLEKFESYEKHCQAQNK